jgi:DNA-binding NtrC family response regulator
LSEAGGEIVGPAATIDIAAAHIADSSFDVALLDANLGGHSVEGLAAALTQRNVPFAFVTGYGRDALPEAFRQAHVVGKPFGTRELLQTIGQLVQQRSTLVVLPGGRSEVR